MNSYISLLDIYLDKRYSKSGIWKDPGVGARDVNPTMSLVCKNVKQLRLLQLRVTKCLFSSTSCQPNRCPLQCHIQRKTNRKFSTLLSQIIITTVFFVNSASEINDNLFSRRKKPPPILRWLIKGLKKLFSIKWYKFRLANCWSVNAIFTYFQKTALTPFWS